MKAKTIFFFLIILVAATSVIAQERGPAVVSPGSDVGIAIVGESCPTFSWAGVEWAEAYRVAVFEAALAEVLSYEEMETTASLVLSKEIKGQALSWTPSSEERLSNGGMYVWYIQAADAYGNVMWSEGKMFKVEVEARLVGMEETVRESLKEHGVSEDVIDDVLRDMESGVKEVVVWGVDTEGSGSKTQDKLGVQGLEGTNNTFYGIDAGFSIASGGNFNSFFGHSAGYNTTTGDENTFMGHYSGVSNTTASYSTFIGFYSGYYNTIGYYNTFIGSYGGYYNTTGSYNTFIGSSAGRSNSTGNSSTFIGYQAGRYNTWAGYNTFIGYYAGNNNTYGITDNGIFSLYNTFIGCEAGRYNTSGFRNTFIGYRAGLYNIEGDGSVFLGMEAGYYNTTGYGDVFLGYRAGYNNETGIGGVFLGYRAGYNNETGDGNVFLGMNAGFENQSGSRNVFLGYYAGHNETGSNKLYIDNSNTSSPLIYGEFDNDILAINGKLGVGTHSPSYPMHLKTSGTKATFVADRQDGATNYINATAGYGNFGTVNDYPLRLVVNGLWKMRLDSDQSLTMANGATCTAGGVWTDASSRDLKENIHTLTTEEAIDALKGLNPVKYNYKTDKEENCVGFIAEEVPDLVASKDRKGMSPMDVVAVLTKVVQEQQELAEKQQQTIEKLQKKIDELERKSK